MPNSIKELLLESKKTISRVFQYDITSPTDFKNVIIDDEAFEMYKASLSENIPNDYKLLFDQIADQTRIKLLESINSVYNLSTYETLALPILSVFFPRLVMKEMVTVRPIEAPDTIMPFLKYSLLDAQGNKLGDLPITQFPASFGPAVTEDSNKFITVGKTKILEQNNLSPSITAVEKSFKIYRLYVKTSTNVEASVNVNITTSVDGYFSGTVNAQNIGVIEVNGKITYSTGEVLLSVLAPQNVTLSVVQAYYTCRFSLERNTMNTRIKTEIDKRRLIVEDQQISADWTVQLEQDFKALYDLDIQAQIIDILAKQMALDIDNWLLKDILSYEAELPSSHKVTFSRNPPSGYTLGPIYWQQNLIERLTYVSSVIYKDTHIGEGNVIGCNPVDAAMFEGLNKFSFDGKGSDGGNIGYSSGTLAQRWKVFSSPIFPEGKVIVMHKPEDVLGSIYVYAPYQPAVITPYPLGTVPTLTIISRNAKLFYRPLGVAIINIV